MVALRAFERSHVITGLVVRLDARKPHLGTALRAAGTFGQLLKGLMIVKLAHDFLLRSAINLTLILLRQFFTVSIE